jgi:hypothetical protein
LGDGPPTETTDSLADAEMPPGTNETGIVDSGTLLEAHADTLETTDYVWEYNYTTVQQHSGDRTIRILEGTDRATAGGLVSESYRDQVPPGVDELTNRTVEVYGIGTIQYEKIVSNDQTRYRTTEGPSMHAASTSDFQQYFFAGTFPGAPEIDWEPVSTTTRRGLSAVVFEPAVADGADTTVDGRLVIDSYGVIHEGTLEIESEGDDGVRAVVTSEIDTTADVTIEEPSWLDEAKNATE